MSDGDCPKTWPSEITWPHACTLKAGHKGKCLCDCGDEN